MRRARIEPSAYGSAGVSHPAMTYAGSSARTVPSSRCRVQITSQVSRPKDGTMNAAYTAKKPYSPNAAEPFHRACMPIASSSPASGSSARRRRCRPVESAAIPKPMPVSTVNSGWANGDITTRTKKVAAVTEAMPLSPVSWSVPKAVPR